MWWGPRLGGDSNMGAGTPTNWWARTPTDEPAGQ